MDKRLKWAIAAQVVALLIWVWQGVHNLLTEIDTADYVCLWIVVLAYIFLAAFSLYGDGKRSQRENETYAIMDDIIEKYRELHMINMKAIAGLIGDRHALLALVPDEKKCATCKHFGQCRVTCVDPDNASPDCENSDCPCKDCIVTGGDKVNWEWVGLEEAEHAGTD